jgi:peptidyl-tRNA hydrolase, PTH1 family
MLVVGLGNPGPRYADTPHNVGFRVLDHLAEGHSLSEGHSFSQSHSFSESHFGFGRAGWTERFDAHVTMAAIDTEQLVLLKPQTYMNRSGESVRKAMSFFKISVESALVVHDELDLPLATLKLKRGGGEAGHNGLKSVSAELGVRDYARLRVGVGRPLAGEVKDYLLTPLDDERASELRACFDEARSAIELWAREGIEQAMNQVNRSKAPGASSRSEAGQPD